MDTLTLKDWPTSRQYIQVVSGAILSALVAYGFIESSVAALIVAFIAAILPNTLALFNSPSELRSWGYLALGAVQALLVGLHVWTDAQISPVVTLILAVLGVSVAVTHTPTPLAAAVPPKE